MPENVIGGKSIKVVRLSAIRVDLIGERATHAVHVEGAEHGEGVIPNAGNLLKRLAMNQFTPGILLTSNAVKNISSRPILSIGLLAAVSSEEGLCITNWVSAPRYLFCAYSTCRWPSALSRVTAKK